MSPRQRQTEGRRKKKADWRPYPGAGADRRSPPELNGALDLRPCLAPPAPRCPDPRGERGAQQRQRWQQLWQQGVLWREGAHQEPEMRRGETRQTRETEGEPWEREGGEGWVGEVASGR